MAVTYESLSEMVSKANSPEPFKNAIGPGFEYNSHNSQIVAGFYEQWSVYLSPISQVFAWFFMIPGWFTKSLYSMIVSLEHIYNNMFKLFGFLDYLSNDNTFVGTIYNSLQLLGLAIFSALVILTIVASFFTGLLKYRDLINHFLLVTAVTAFFPQAIKAIGGVMAQDAYNVKTLQVADETRSGTVQNSTLAIQPFRDNVVDLLVLIKNDFNRTTLGQGDDGYLTRGKASVEFNNITDSNINSTDFASWYGVPEKEPLQEFINKSATQPQYYGVATLLTSQLKTNEPGDVRIANLKKWYTGVFNVFTPVYMRYKVNWIGLFAQQLILVALLFSMGIKFVVSIFGIIMGGMVVPIVGYTSATNSSKFKELLYTVSGTFAGGIFEIIILRVAMSFLRDFPTIAVNGLSNISGGFFDGLGYWEGVTASLMVYAGVYFAATSGNHSIERWLGVNTGQNMGKRMLATAGAAYFGTRAAINTGSALATGAVNGLRNGADGIHAGAQTARKGLHAATHPGETLNGIKDSLAEKYGGIKDKLTDLHDSSMSKFRNQVGDIGAGGIGGDSGQPQPTNISSTSQSPEASGLPTTPPTDFPTQNQGGTGVENPTPSPTTSSGAPGGIKEPQQNTPTANPKPLGTNSNQGNTGIDTTSATNSNSMTEHHPVSTSGNSNSGIKNPSAPKTKSTAELNPKKDEVLSNMEGLPVKGKFTIDDFDF